MTAHVLVTGAYRSGTTVVEKILHAQRRVSIASQPLPYLYVHAKRAFLRECGYEDRYPLGHLFREDRYTRRDLLDFLEGYTMDRRTVHELVRSMRGYSGFWSRELLEHVQDLHGGTVLQVQQRTHLLLADAYGEPDPVLAGSKEILNEEFVPYLLTSGESVVLVVRDIRNVVKSLLFGRARKYVGAPRPTLFHIRNWRKSVAVALSYEDHPRCAVLRFEDVISDPTASRERAMSDLGYTGSGGSVDLDNLEDQHGEEWSGNSSFPDSTSLERPDFDLPTRAYIDTLAGPELRALGYRAPAAVVPDMKILTGFVEPVPIEREDIPADYSSDPDRLQDEITRLTMLAEDPDLSPEEEAEWFLFPGVMTRLAT